MVRLSVVLIGLALTTATSADPVSPVLDPSPRTQSVEVGADIHHPPVDAPIIDPFRPPAQPWLAGNRGVEYDTTDGQVVRASAAGVVTFSGQVGGNVFVTIRHSSDLRTTVGFVTSALVATGDSVERGQPIAIAGTTMHFSARRDGEYIDPTSLFVQGRVVVRLIPEPG